MIHWWQNWSNWFIQKVYPFFFAFSYKILSTPATQVWRLFSFHQRCLIFWLPWTLTWISVWSGFTGQKHQDTMWVNQKPPVGHFVENWWFYNLRSIPQIESNWTKHPKRIKHETQKQVVWYNWSTNKSLQLSIAIAITSMSPSCTRHLWLQVVFHWRSGFLPSPTTHQLINSSWISLPPLGNTALYEDRHDMDI